MGIFDDIREGLKREFDRRKAANKKYSLRAFAKSIDLPPSRLSEFLNKKRFPSQVHLEKINQALGASWNLQLTSINHIENKTTFSEEQLEVITNWLYPAILTYLKEKRSGYNTDQLADFFFTSSQNMQNVLNSLQELKLIQKKENLYYWQPGPERSTDQISNNALRKFHQKNLDIAKEKIESVPLEERDFSSTIMTIDPSKIDFAKKEIKSFRRKLCTILESGNKTQVYSLNIQLFPLSKNESKTP